MPFDADKELTVITRNLTTGYHAGRREVVVSRDINETLRLGEFTCLLGPNGAGKSTVLKTMSAFLPPLGGTILIAGKELRDYKKNELSKIIGVVLTERLSVTNMTAFELVATGRSPYTGFWGGRSQEDDEVIERSMSLTGSLSLRNRRVNTLSDGERQKVMIAKALAQETPVIFLDEPTSFLDYPSKVEIMRLLRSLAHEENKVVFLSTHDLEIALQLTDHVWLMDKKRGLVSGSPAQLSENGKIAEYFNSPGMVYDPASRRFEIIG